VSVFDSLQAFFDRATAPKPEKPPIIPPRWRMPFFIGMTLASLAAIALFIWFVVMPAVRAQSSGAPTTSPHASLVYSPAT
jgi:hypothetical protein